MSTQTDPQDRAALIDLAELVELARRDLLRTSTDFLGRMAQCLSVYEGICEQPDDEWSDATRADADEELTGLIGLALAQLALVRAPDSPLEALQSPSIAEQGKDPLQSYEKFDGVGPHAETIETRAIIGERYLEAYESALNDPRLAGYCPADCPSELLLDMLNTWQPIAEQDGDEAAARRAIEEACEPWEHSVGGPPEYDSPLAQVFDAGLNYGAKLFADMLGVQDYEWGDGSEEYDSDATRTFGNIMIAAGYANDDGDLMLPADYAGFRPTPAPSTDAMREALKLAVAHIKHLARWIGDQQLAGRSSGYSFEALGEDLPGIEAALSARPLGDGLREDQGVGRAEGIAHD